MKRLDEKLFTALARVAGWQVREVNPQELASTAWAFATLDLSDALLFAVLAEAAERHISRFNLQDLSP